MNTARIPIVDAPMAEDIITTDATITADVISTLEILCGSRTGATTKVIRRGALLIGAQRSLLICHLFAA